MIDIGFLNLIDKALLFIVGVSLLSGFLINVFYAFSFRDSSYLGKGVLELGKSFLAPQFTIAELVTNFPTQFSLIAYFMIFMYSIVTIFYLWVIWKFLAITLGKAVSGLEPAYLILGIATLVIYFIISNIASIYTTGNWILNPFPGWTALIFNPQVMLNYFNKYIPENLPP